MIFMKIKKNVISNASWEILNRMFFNRNSKYNGGNKLPWLQKKEYQE